MNGHDASNLAQLRLSGREVLSLQELAGTYFPSLDRADVVACLEFLQDLGLPAGLLRPDDDVLGLLKPPVKKRSISNWLARQMTVANAELLLVGEISQRRDDRGVAKQRIEISSLRHIVEAWVSVS